MLGHFATILPKLANASTDLIKRIIFVNPKVHKLSFMLLRSFIIFIKIVIGTFCPVIVKFGTERRVKPPTNSCREDDDGSNCDKNEFCFLLPRFKTTDKKRFGHCCEAPGSESEIAENTCPVSRPLENVVCPDTKGAPPEFPARIAESDTICPSYSHQCLGSSPRFF